MKSSLSQMAVMNVEKGEEVVGGWATPHIPQVGLYKLLAKKKWMVSSSGRTLFNAITA